MSANAPTLARNDYGYYEIRWAVGGVFRRQSLRTKDATAAQREFGAFLLGKVAQSSYTFAQAWALRQQETLSGLADPQRAVNAWKALMPHVGDMDVCGFLQRDVDDYVTMRNAAGCSTSTARRELVELQATRQHLIATKRLRPGAFTKVQLPDTGAARPHFLTQEQCQTVLQAAQGRRTQADAYTRLELFLNVGLHSGQRRRAIERLLWTQVDFDHDVIHFQLEGERVTKKRKASVPIRSALRSVLAAARSQATTDYVLGFPGSIRTAFDSLMKALELTHVTPHTLRHTFVSHLLMRDVPVYTVGKIVGLTVKQIERTYGHLSDSYLKAAMES